MRQTEHQVTPSPELPAEKAKQGRSGTNVLMVLVCGLVLAFLVWGGLEIFGNAIEPPVAEQIGNSGGGTSQETTSGINGTVPQPSGQTAPAN